MTLRSTSIQYNSAKIGGGIRWNYRNINKESSSVISDNRASLYGNDYASFAREIVYLETDDDYLKYFNKSST